MRLKIWFIFIIFVFAAGAEGSPIAVSSTSPGGYWIVGAYPNNTTDSYVVIQRAIDAVASEATGTITFTGAARGMNAKTINLPNGRYKISNALTIPTGVIFDGNNSVITQMTASTDIVQFIWTTGHGYYGTFAGGLRNITLDGGGVAGNCLLLNKVNWSRFDNINLTGCTTGLLAQEVQYNSFSQITINNNVDGLVLTYAPDQPTFVSIDNQFFGLAVGRNTRYGMVLHAARNNGFYRVDASRNLNADVVIGGTWYNAVAGSQPGNNDFYSYKSEHNRNDVPTSAYSVMIGSNSPGNSFTNMSVSRQTSGTTYDPYFKWLYNAGFGTVINNPYDFTTTTGSSFHENPLVPGDYSIFRAIAFSGLLVNYGPHWQHDYIPMMATDAADTVVSGGSQYTYTHPSTGSLASHSFEADGAGVADVAYSVKIPGETENRFQIFGGGRIEWGDGTISPDTQLYRTTGAAGLRINTGLQVDGLLSGDSVRSIVFTPALKNLTCDVMNGNFDIPGTMLRLLNSTITNTTGPLNGVYIGPTINQASGSGTNSILYIAPTYSAVNTGIQYLVRAQEVGASIPAFSVNREGFVSAVTGTSVASGTTIALTGKVTPITGSNAIVTISLPYTGFSGEVELIPLDGAFTTTTAGNIAIASTATIGRTMRMTYVPATSKWYPSY